MNIKKTNTQLTVPSSPAITKTKRILEPIKPILNFKARPIKQLKTFKPHLDHKYTQVQTFQLPGDEIRVKEHAKIKEDLKRQAILIQN